MPFFLVLDAADVYLARGGGGSDMEVLVCDDHPIVASAIAMTLETALNATVLVASSYQQAKLLAAEHPDVKLCLLDICIPGEDARLEMQVLKSVLPNARFLLFSGSDQDTDLMLALDLGLHGFLPKSSTPEVVEAAMKLVLAGGTYLPSRIGQLAMCNAIDARAISASVVAETKPRGNRLVGKLTDRQQLVLQHLSLGKSNKEIARVMKISPGTVKAHVALIIAALGATNRTEAASRALGLGLIEQM